MVSGRGILLLTLSLLLLVGCGRKESESTGSSSRPGRVVAPTLPSRSKTVEDLNRFSARQIGEPIEGKPWIAHLKAIDLDQDGLLDVVGCEAEKNTVFWIRQTAPGVFEERVLASDMRVPVHVEEQDMDFDGDLDLLVSSMGFLFPNNSKIGSIFILENDGAESFEPHLIIEEIDRVTDVRAADFTGDGKLDLAVGQFGYDQGEVRWMKWTGPGKFDFASEVLLQLSGTINVCIADFDGNRALDFAALVSQQWEEMHIFLNDGNGYFSKKVVWGSTNEDYSSSGMSMADLNGDGRIDLLFSNGDGFGPTPDPGPKPWHGVQWLENTGQGNFRFHRIGDLGGAYAPMACDVDSDGLKDVVALAAFNDWSKPKSEALVWFRNLGDERFEPRVLAYQPTHLTTLAVGDFNGDGIPELVTGGFHAYPPYDRMSRVLIWEQN